MTGRCHRTGSPWAACAAAALLAVLPAAPLPAQAPAAPAPASQSAPLSWTDWADLALAAPVVLIADVRRAGRLGRRAAPDVPAGQVRALVEADLRAVLKAPGVLPAAAAWVWQGAADARGRPPIARGARLLVFAQPLSGGRDPATQPLALIAGHAQQPWTPQAEAVVRSILTEALDPRLARLAVTGVQDAFRTEGDVPGQSESQFFVATGDGRPITLVVRRAPGEAAQVLAATGDLVGRAEPIRPRTLSWRALACGLPARLPLHLDGRPELARDYALVVSSLGACGRTRPSA